MTVTDSTLCSWEIKASKLEDWRFLMAVVTVKYEWTGNCHFSLASPYKEFFGSLIC